MSFPLDVFPAWAQDALTAFPENPQVYLVGGAVRDYLLHQPIHDLDFIVLGNPIVVGRHLARKLTADFYVLDQSRMMARVVMKVGEERRITLDLTPALQNDLKMDLEKRDFTINAIAMDLSNGQIIDIHDGQTDLHQKIIRPCSDTALQDDPLRSLRAIRLAASLGLRIAGETIRQMKESAPLLVPVAAERKRDELYRILEGRKPDTALRMMEHVGILPYFLPELAVLKGVRQSLPHIYDVWEHTLSTLHYLEILLNVLERGGLPDPRADVFTSAALLHLRPFREQITRHLASPINENRSVRSILMFCALYHDSAKPQMHTIDDQGRIRAFGHEDEGMNLASQRVKDLSLSKHEEDRVTTVIKNHMRIHLLAHSDEPPTRRAIFRFFRDAGPAGIDLCLLSLADTQATYGYTLTPTVWEKELKIVAALLEAWWEKPQESVAPLPIINGDDLQQELGLKPGKEIGKVLALVYEAQASGQVQDRKEALELARSILANK